MTTSPRRKLIEVSLPLEDVNREAAREKGIRQGHPSTLHLWWARRPLGAARAILFAQLVDDPSSHPEMFPTSEEQAAERARLHQIIKRLVNWDNRSDTELLGSARAAIVRSAPGGRVPEILDPFAGGGTIPIEALRLGLPAIANDLNPVAALLNEVSITLPSRFRLRGPVSGGLSTSVPDALAQDLTHWAAVLEDRVRQDVASLYRPGTDGAVPLVFFWARTVRCPNPACRANVPLVGQWRIAGRAGREAYMRPIFDAAAREFDVEIEQGVTEEPLGTIKRTSGHCPNCYSGFPLSYVKEEATAGRMGARLLAVQEKSGDAKWFRPATDLDRRTAAVKSDVPEWLQQPLSTHKQYMAPPRYGLREFGDLFSDRQLATLTSFVRNLREVSRQAEIAARNAGLGGEDNRGYAEGGVGPKAYGEAMRILLALSISRLVNRSSTLCIWHANGAKVEQVFSMQAYKMTWLFAEANPFGGASGSYVGQVDYLAKAIAGMPEGEGVVSQGPAQNLSSPPQVVVSTDPPYYDSVPYADLSDFFMVWLRAMLGEILPRMFPTVLAPKAEELVADHERLGSRAQANRFFETNLGEVFRRVRQQHSDSYPMTVYYAYKATETDGQLEGATGWSTFLQALIDAGWFVTGTWPVRTEQAGGLRELGRNALASSIVVVCRKRLDSASTIGRRGFLAALKQELPQSLREMQQGAVAPVDLAQSTIGPGMAVFSRYAKVLEADGTKMSVRTALGLINQALDEVLAEQDGDLDADSRFCLKWYVQYGWTERPFGEADVLARATNTSVEGLARGGVLTSKAGRVRLLSTQDLPAWDPSADDRTSVWEATLHLARVLDVDGIEAAGALIARAGQRVDLEAVQLLAYRLYELSQANRPADALLFNALGTSWADLSAVARRVPASRRVAQSAFDLDALQ